MSTRVLDPLGDPHSMAYELGATTRQRLFRVCCASIDDHRFDCRAVDPGRGSA